MSKSSKSTTEWDKHWQEYSKMLEKWKEVFQTFQNTTLEMQKKYNEVMEQAAVSSSKDTMKQFGENWQKAMNQAGMDTFKQFSTNWENAMNEYTANAFKQFSENWQNTLNQSGMEYFKSYGDMMNKFAETWKNMWQK